MIVLSKYVWTTGYQPFVVLYRIDGEVLFEAVGKTAMEPFDSYYRYDDAITGVVTISPDLRKKNIVFWVGNSGTLAPATAFKLTNEVT